MSKTKNGGLDQYGAEPFKQQQFVTAGIEGVNTATQQAYIIHQVLSRYHTCLMGIGNAMNEPLVCAVIICQLYQQYQSSSFQEFNPDAVLLMCLSSCSQYFVFC